MVPLLLTSSPLALAPYLHNPLRYHYSVEYFEDLRNINHCEFVIMKRDPSNKFILQNTLRTWSAYQLEQRKLRLAAADAEKGDRNEATDAVDVSGIKDDRKSAAATTPAEALALDQSYGTPQAGVRYGGCPYGCNHDKINGLAREPSVKKPIKREVSFGRDGGGTLSGDGSEDDADSEKSGNETENTKRERRERVELQAAEAKRDCEGMSDDDDPAARLRMGSLSGKL